MADLDITKNNLGNQTHVIPGDPGAAEYTNADFAEGKSISTMIPVLTANGYTVAQINKMTKNDMVMALRIINGARF